MPACQIAYDVSLDNVFDIKIKWNDHLMVKIWNYMRFYAGTQIDKLKFLLFQTQ